MMQTNKVYNDDCLKIMKTFEDESIHLGLTDAPYGIDLKPTRKTSKFAKVEIANDKNLDWLQDFYNELFRITKNASFVFCGWSTIDEFMSKAKKAGFEVKNVIVWNKMHFGLGYNFRPVHEFILLLTKKMYKTKSKNLSNILSFKRMHHTKMQHVAEKPVDLLKLLIEESTEEGDIVLDSFAGSGSTLEAAKLLNRKYIGIELDKGYYDNIVKRLAD